MVAGRAVGRGSEREVTVFDSVGFALEDFSALRYLRRLHLEQRGNAPQLDLVPSLADPKDLFGSMPQSSPRTARAKVEAVA